MNIFFVIFIVAGIILFLYLLKAVKLRYVFLSALCGLAALFAIDFLASFIEIEIPINYFSLAMSSLGGLPGVILFTVLMTFLM